MLSARGEAQRKLLGREVDEAAEGAKPLMVSLPECPGGSAVKVVLLGSSVAEWGGRSPL